MPENLKLLIVDDNEEFCRNMADIMELKGYQAAMAHNGPQAIEMVQKDGFDVILMDIKMPAMNGVDAFKQIKGIAPDIPVIMITAFAVEDLIREALREGAFGALHKPLDFDSLFQHIEQALPDGALILVVDNDENICANLEDVLTARNYRVNIATDGKTALEKTRQNTFDVILLDLKLPPLHGLETYLNIRDIRPNVTVLIITGYRQEMGELAGLAVEKNAYACLEKPIDMDNLLTMLDRIQEQKNRGITPEKPWDRESGNRG
jgi:DNA-binding NtrC family response regulator